MDKLDRLGPEGVALLLGAGRKDESGAFTKGAGLAAPAISSVLAFVQSGGGTRRETLDRIAGVIGGSPQGDEGLADLDRIDAALKALGVSIAVANCWTKAEFVFAPSITWIELTPGAEAEITWRSSVVSVPAGSGSLRPMSLTGVGGGV